MSGRVDAHVVQDHTRPATRRLRTVQNAFFLILLLGVSVGFIWIIHDFLQPVFWAAILAVLFQPFYLRLRAWLGGRSSPACLLTIGMITVIVILPLFLVGVAVSREAVTLYDRLASGEIDWSSSMETLEQALPLVGRFTSELGIDLDRIHQGLNDALGAGSRYLAAQILNVGQNALRISLSFLIMLYLLFYFIRDGDRGVALLVQAIPLGSGRERRLLDRLADTARATIMGTIIVGGVQGTLGGILFWILGIGAAVFWGAVMTLLSILPGVGTGLVWVPAAIILIVQGDYGRGIGLLAAGTVLIGLSDNVLRPILVARKTRIPDYLVLLSTFGGLTTLGISGFVVGPLLAAVFLTVWEMFVQEYRKQGSAPSGGRTV